MSDQSTPPRIETDWRVPLWFFAWLAVMFLCSGAVVLVVFAWPEAQRYVGDHPWLILVCVALAFFCVAAAVAPFFLGIRCRQCRRKLRRMAVATDLNTGNAPLRFYCSTCNVIWQTRLVSGPGRLDGDV